MSTLKFADTHNMITFLSKPTKSDGFEQIVDFLNAHPIKYALTVNPTIYTSCIEQLWSTIKVKTINGESQLDALVDGKKIIITESSVRRDLQLADENGIDCLTNSTIFKQLALMGYPKSSDPTKNVADEAVYKELGDSLVRAATTASSLEAEQDNGNINKTQSKATPNESSSLGTTSGGGPRCQETMGDTIAQTRFENVSKHSNDSLLARGNTLQSDEDRLKLDELMALCTTLQNRVLDLEKTKTTQHNEIASLKRRVKKLEKKNRSRTHKLKRLYKVGLTARVESSDNEESLGEDASKQGRIDAIDADKEITLVSVQNVDEEMFDVNVLNGEDVFVTEHEVAANKENDEVNVVEEVVEVIKTDKLIVDDAQVSVVGNVVSTVGAVTTVSAATTTTDDDGKGILIEPVTPIKKKDRIRFDEEEELSIEEKATLLQQLLNKRRKHFAAKRAKEKRNKPPRKAQQRKIMYTFLKNMEGYKLNDLKLKEFDSIQLMFDRAFKRVNTFEDFRTELVEDEEDVTINAIPLAINHMLKSFNMKDLEDLYKLVKAKYESTRPMEDLDLLLWGDLKTMFEPHVEDKVWRNQKDWKVLDWKLYDSYGVYSLRMQHMQIYMLVEKKYPLTPSTLSMMLEKKLIIDYESEMAY
ncbi:hypothetical protein Tco_1141716 [Tanacetum coccineum]